MLSRFNKRFITPLNSSLGRRYQLKPLETGRITENVWAVKTDTVNFFIVDTGDGLACFDAGYRRMLIRDELKKLGFDRESVSYVFLTHADIDHTRGVSLFTNADVYLSRDEKQLLTGLRTMRSAVRTPHLRCEYHLLRDGDKIKAGNTTIEAIATPGHTPGSMAYLLDGRYLFTGDTCKLGGGKAYAGSHYTMDIKRQYESIRKLAALQNVEYVFTAHAGYSDDFDNAFSDWRD